MKKIIITVGSVTYAIKLRKLLAREGIEARHLKVDNTDSGAGCSHGVEINEADLYRAVYIMRENRIEYSFLRAKK